MGRIWTERMKENNKGNAKLLYRTLKNLRKDKKDGAK